MIFYCLSETGYETSSWYKHIINGLINEKKSKRFTVILIDSSEEIEKFPVNYDDVMLIIGSGSQWLNTAINLCKEKFENRIIVLGNCERILNGKKYSIVASDVSRDIMLLYKYLRMCGKNSIAMYGINPLSASDNLRKNSFLECSGSQRDIFVNNANLKECFEVFKQKAEIYDGIICANDYCAISLIKHLKKEGIPLPYIVSGGETMLGREFSPSITNLKTNYPNFGKAAVQVSKILIKNDSVNSVDVHLAGEIIPGETTDFMPVVINELSSSVKIESSDKFYNDDEVAEMLKIEKLLNSCDKNDNRLLKLLTKGKTYSEIADELFMSTNGIKYKIKAMFEICEVTSKSEFLELVKKYIN